MLQGFDRKRFDLSEALTELAEFRTLLDRTDSLKERDDVLASFDCWPNLCVLFGKFHLKVNTGDHFRREFSVANLMRADLAVTRADSGAFCLVEFEGASPDCIFKKSGSAATHRRKRRRPRQVPEWAEPFEKGFSQIVDWAWAVETHRTLPEVADAFNTERPDCAGLLVIGRDTALASRAATDRWRWRGKHVTVANWPLALMTYDELYEDFAVALDLRQDDARLATRTTV